MERTARMDAEHQAAAGKALLDQQQGVNRAMRAEIERLTAVAQQAAAAAHQTMAASPSPPATQTDARASLQRAQQRRQQQQQQQQRWPTASPGALPVPRPTSGGAAAAAVAAAASEQAALDQHIAALERELAAMEGARPDRPRTGQEQQRRASPRPPLPPRAPSPLPSADTFPSPAAAASPPLPPLWHSNPLAASPEKPPPPQAGGRSTTASEATAAPRASLVASSLPQISLSEEAQWRLLEQGLQQQRQAERRLAGVAASGSVVTDDAAGAASVAGMHRPRLSVTIPGDINRAASLAAEETEVSGSCTGGSAAEAARRALPSPDLGQMAMRASADWLNASVDADIERLEVKSAAKGAPAGRVVAVHAVAGGGGVSPGARHSLFDLARPDVEL
jgi:hypothetical protein